MGTARRDHRTRTRPSRLLLVVEDELEETELTLADKKGFEPRYPNKLREQGVPLREAIVQANHVRLRPILMTTLSIVAGLIPTAVGIGAGSAQRSAVAVTIIGGQMLCLLPTLLVTPVAYSLFSEAEARSGYALLGWAIPWFLGRRARS